MRNLREIIENSAIDLWTRHFAHAPFQINRPHESDSELIALPNDPDHYLAVTLDTVSEEITSGIYSEPDTMGWVTVMASLSDLAAVGATPLGLVISVSVEPTRDQSFVDGIARGMAEACQASGVFILGGDTNFTREISLTACAFGLVASGSVMTRMGCQPGDSVFVTRLMGLGNALGLARLNAHPGILFPEKLFRPVANLRESMLIRNHATCCMDTSDGLLATLDQLMRINNLGFAIECDWKRILVPEAIELCRQAGIPLWTMAAGPHGEFALLFTIPRKRQESFLREASSCAFDPIYLGRVKEEPALTLKRHDASWVDVDMCYLRNLLYLANGDFKRYIREFLEYGIKAGLE